MDHRLILQLEGEKAEKSQRISSAVSISLPLAAPTPSISFASPHRPTRSASLRIKDTMEGITSITLCIFFLIPTTAGITQTFTDKTADVVLKTQTGSISITFRTSASRTWSVHTRAFVWGEAALRKPHRYGGVFSFHGESGVCCSRFPLPSKSSDMWWCRS